MKKEGEDKGKGKGEAKMKAKTLFICLVLVSALIVGIVVAVISTDMLRKGVNMNEKEQETNESLVIASKDELLGKYEKSDRLFIKKVIGDTIVYGHKRMIDDAIVEGDRIVYQFDKDTKELKKKIIHWRDDLPEHLPPVISKEQAESIAGGGSATLYYLSPETGSIFRTQSPPKNPCWVVWKTIKTDKYGPYYNITVVDAVEGKILGYGTPPPTTGFSFTGPHNATNCSGGCLNFIRMQHTGLIRWDIPPNL